MSEYIKNNSKKSFSQILIKNIINLIYPNVCGFCGKIEENCLCEECEKMLDRVLIYKTKYMQDKFFDRHIYLAKYEGQFRNYILSYKFFDKPYLYKAFTKLILKNKKICGIIR